MQKVFESPSDLSDYLFRIVDNGGATADRYTVVFSDGSCLMMSANPTHPLGVSMCSEAIDPQAVHDWVENGEAVDLALGDLGPKLVQHIMDRNNQGLDDFLRAVEAREPWAVAGSREQAAINDGTPTSLGEGIYFSEDGYRIRLDDTPAADRGPYKTAREAVLGSMPDAYSLSGPEYHTTIGNLMRMTVEPDVQQKVAELEAKLEADVAAKPGL